ncbi:MAG: hypothetical protein E6Z83_03690 [Pantoea sp.]|uniref:hypothetical protein n=1 Tax=Pantoea sp. TaxID=69393 RepID=UPI002906D323|nr:hypothetical protein [Pantoea sp.]MDU5779891.1 hypothetical protein [Pantoea sp.]
MGFRQAEPSRMPRFPLTAQCPGCNNSQAKRELGEKGGILRRCMCASTPSQSSLTLDGLIRACAAPRLFKSGSFRERRASLVHAQIINLFLCFIKHQQLIFYLPLVKFLNSAELFFFSRLQMDEF